jgi:hypothetical protein
MGARKGTTHKKGKAHYKTKKTMIDERLAAIEAKLDRVLELLDPRPDDALSARVESLRERLQIQLQLQSIGVSVSDSRT